MKGKLMKTTKWTLIFLGSVISAVTCFSDPIIRHKAIEFGPKSYTILTFGIFLIIIGVVFFDNKKKEK